MDTSQFDILLESFKLEIGTVVLGWIMIILGLVVKDVLSSASFGLSFYLDPHFNEGETIFFDDEECIIQKIGLTTTVLRNVNNGRWKFIPNKRIKRHKLEKKIDEKKGE